MTTYPHGEKNLAKIATTLRKNQESDYTEAMTRLREGFRYADHAALPWQVEHLSLFAGSPVWEQASATQRLALNHLWWVAFYQLISAAERHTIEYNQLCTNAFFPLRGYESVCLELDLETTQERHHIHAFRAVSEATEDAVLGFRVFTPAEAKDRVTLTDRMQRGLRGVKRGVFAGVGALFASRVSRSPFLASQYFLLRAFFNFVAKHKEAQAFERHRESTARGEPVAAPLAIVHYHYLDEAFHTAVSQLLSHELYRDFGKPSAAEAYTVNFSVQTLQRTLFCHLGSIMAGSLGDDAVALPHGYAVLRSRVFGMGHADAMEMLRRSFCEEHQGFHTSAEYLEKWLGAARRNTADVEYLTPANRDMREVTATVGDVLAKNRRSFDAFARTRRDEAPAYST